MSKIKCTSSHHYCETIIKLILRNYGERIEESLWKLNHIYVGEELSVYIDEIKVPFTVKGEAFYFEIDAENISD